MQRRLTPELMDDPNVNKDDLARSLRYIRAVNRFLGGRAALLKHLKAWSRRWPPSARKGGTSPIHLLDVATGSADLPIAARAWALRRGFDLRITATDNHQTTLALAREHLARAPSDVSSGITLLELDARDLTTHFIPAGRASTSPFHYVHAGLFIHHLTELEALTTLRAMDRLAKVGLVWNDLMRSRIGELFIRLATLGQPTIVRHDARVSVQAGFTKREVLDFARRLDLHYTRYASNTLTHRFTLAGEKTDHHWD